MTSAQGHKINLPSARCKYLVTHPRIKVAHTNYHSREAGRATPSPALLRTPVSRSSRRTCHLPAPISFSTTQSFSEDPHLTAPYACASFSAVTLELLAYLQDPELVARFQRRCGLFLVEGARQSGGRSRAPAGDPVPADKAREHLRARCGDQDMNSNFRQKEDGYADGVSRFVWGNCSPKYLSASSLNMILICI